MFSYLKLKYGVCVMDTKVEGQRIQSKIGDTSFLVGLRFESLQNMKKTELYERKENIPNLFYHNQSFFRAIFISFLSYYCVGCNFEFWQNIIVVKE